MSDPVFGIGITRADDEQRSAVKTDMSVIGLVGTAPNADPDLFPLNDPVMFFSDDAAAVTGLGATGSLVGTLDLINAQLDDFQASAQVIFVRVEQGQDDKTTITNIVGNSSLKTGMHALRIAGPKLGLVPRLVGFPGYTHQRDTGVSAVAIGGAGGAGYAAGDAVSGTGGGGTGFAATVGTVDGSGKILTVNITNHGSGYTSAPTLAITSENGSGATLTATISSLANAVCAAAPALLSALLAHAVVSGPHSTLQAYNDWRETLSSDRLIPVETWAKVGVDGTDVDSVPIALGIGVRRDHENGGSPALSWANQAINGIVGPSRMIEFSLTDGATEGQQILLNNGSIILRGEAGVETAIAASGFIFVGTDNAGEDDLWRFYNVTRNRDYLNLIMLKTLRYYLGRFNLTGHVIEAVIQTVKTALRDEQANDNILGFNVTFTRDQNSPDNLRLGRFNMTFAAEEAPVLRYLGLTSARYRPALDALLDDLLVQLDTAV